MTVTAEENTATTVRSATISLKTTDGKATVTVKVTQSSANVIFSVDRNEFNVAAAGESFTVKVTHNIGYKITSQPDWVKQTGKASNGNVDTYTFKAGANTSTEAREGVIVFCNDNNECVPVTVKQTGTNATLSVSPTSMTFTAKAESKTFSVTSNTTWTATSSADWVKLGTTSGSGNAQVTVTTDENTALTQRSATISLRTTDGRVSTSIKVTQSAANESLSISPTVMVFAAKSESKTFNVSSNTAWTATSDATWLKLNASSGSGNAQVTATAEENTATKQRIAAITLKTKDGKVTATIKVSQNGADIIFRTDNDEYKIGAEGGEIQFVVYHNVECRIKETPEWAILYGMETYDGATLYKVKIIPNTSTSERGGIIAIRSLDENEYELPVLVIQAGSKPKGGNENTTTGEEITIE